MVNGQPGGIGICAFGGCGKKVGPLRNWSYCPSAIETAAHVAEGVREAMRGGGRAGNLEIVLDEMDAARRALDRSRHGDLVVLCVDYATEVWQELESRRSLAQPRVLPVADGDGKVEGPGGDPDLIDFEVGL